MVLHLSRGRAHGSATRSCTGWPRCSTRAMTSISTQGTYRVRGDVIDIFPAESEKRSRSRRAVRRRDRRLWHGSIR
jgi:hypothetical protein